MLEKIGHIKNPLTVIAMFAGIAELSGTVVLPFLEKPIQEVYVWFLMGFPVLMIYLFYRTLWRDHTVLYAPSDFQKDESFMQAHFKKYSEGEVDTPFSDISSEVEVFAAKDVEQEPHATESESLTPDPFEPPIGNVETDGDKRIHVSEKYLLKVSKRRILSRLSRLCHGAYHEDVEPKQLPNVKFDGVVESLFSFCVVGFVRGNDENKYALRDAFSKMNDARLFWNTLSDEEKSKFSLHVALMRLKGEHPVSERMIKKVQLLKAKFPFKIDVAEYICEKRSLDTNHLCD
ncbi:hypothetical protein [Pseudomonas sp. FP2294]|uniref:hypothetical protein n=1 Tax=Pseudomonas sp. FP2294 TaxID=2954089 RepID=UPI002737052D|nr:hypothetical protein [Pseudomonas sp. FP2294]WLH55599.1 hypothetical protein PSH73_16900 [Pseudomonas sp. FP2294]